MLLAQLLQALLHKLMMGEVRVGEIKWVGR